MARETIELDGASLNVADLPSIAAGEGSIVLSNEAKQRMEASRKVIDEVVGEGRVVYGVTTGFGVFSEVHISPSQSRELQRNLVRSHCTGVGEPFSDDVVRVMMVLRANALAKGFSGIRVEVVERILEMLRRGVLPLIPSQGSVGASGDLAPLAHLAAALIGEGRVRTQDGVGAAKEALRDAGLEPIELEAKEGLALINGTQTICAVGGLAVAEARGLFERSLEIAAMTLDALQGTDVAFDARLHDARPHEGQRRVATRMRELMQGSEIRASHRDCGKLQDAYSLRCIPQVHGAVLDALDFVERTFGIEINSATDNPLVFADEGEVLSGGNFHGAPVAMACDLGAIAMTDLGSISERRIERMVNPQLSELPGFLVAEGGLNSGLMIAQVTAAALVAECRALAHPASVDSIPTSANKEDHVSMGPTAAWKFARIVDNVRSILAIEAICAAQAIEFRRPLRSSGPIERLHAGIRSVVAPLERDRFLHDDIIAARALLGSGS